MKKLFTNTLLVALTVFASAAYATDVDAFVKNRGEKSFSVHYNDTGLFKVSIKDVNGLVIHSEKSAQDDKFVKTFSLRDLPTGIYYLELEDNKKISTFQIDVSKTDLLIHKDLVSKLFKPSIKQNEKTVDVSMLKLSNDPLNLSIYNSSNELIHKDSVEGDVVNKRFDLSKLRSGSYSLLFEVGSKTFKETIELN